jgi:hypothetical protein
VRAAHLFALTQLRLAPTIRPRMRWSSFRCLLGLSRWNDFYMYRHPRGDIQTRAICLERPARDALILMNATCHMLAAAAATRDLATDHIMG